MTFAETDGRRAIALRNRETILDAALTVLQQNPEAGINDIADDAGLSRATLYRHFPTREDLLHALRQRARAQGKQAMQDAQPDEGDPIEALERMVTALFEVGARNRVLFGTNSSKPTIAERERHFEPVTRTFERAQREGLLDPDIAATWLTAAMRNLFGAAIAEIKAGRLERSAAPKLIVRQIVDGARKR